MNDMESDVNMIKLFKIKEKHMDNVTTCMESHRPSTGAPGNCGYTNVYHLVVFFISPTYYDSPTYTFQTLPNRTSLQAAIFRFPMGRTTS
ncbi:hypothetical protein LXL04_039148 [Taraxacum kok-saghyz]